ncbi:hypothetical protein OJF2_13610 [Aquisphaera giovannonii]|uniref:Uncharacterized protein n=1 Tax=Aquisphaera giovannonii TaxID=406548 RepID=A0A5B9VWP3_9BACT|nr:hypothetical protein [Aquisphaera giovannonii]QEH32876.1 hypothetical protein OJF2_13610 [Aquisphaera giovannonii]
MRLEILIQFIVPLTFLAIWALTTLLNRDAQPLPPRPARPGGPRPAPGPGQRPAPAMGPPRPFGPAEPARQGGGLARPLEDAGGWKTVDADPRALAPRRLPPRTAPGGLDDAIVYIENDPSGSRTTSRPLSAGTGGLPATSPSRGARGGQARRGARTRSAGGNLDPRRAAAPETQRPLTDQVQQSLARKKARPLEIVPLSTPLTPLSQPLTEQSSENVPRSPLAVGVSPSSDPMFTGAQVLAMLAGPARLREAVLLAEILQPPLALRPRRPRG